MISVLSPTKEWGPAVDIHRTGRYANSVSDNGSSQPPDYNGYGNPAYVPEIELNKTQL